MRGRFFRGMAAGALLGAAAGMFFMPQMDRRTRKRIERAGRNLAGYTADIWDEMKSMAKK